MPLLPSDHLKLPAQVLEASDVVDDDPSVLLIWMNSKRRRRNKAITPPAVYEQKWFLREYGTRLRLRFECHRCGGPISEAMHFCPWCGRRENRNGGLKGKQKKTA